MLTLPQFPIDDASMLASGVAAAALTVALLLKIATRRRTRLAIVSASRPSEAGSGTQPMSRTYRTEDGRFYFRFSFERGPNGYRAFIDDGPSYSAYDRDDSLHATHRLYDGGRYYVCWTEPLWTFEDAKSVAKLWAEKTARYLVTGQRF